MQVEGTGESIERAIRFEGVFDGEWGVALIWQYLDMRFGPRSVAWSLERQETLGAGGRDYDVMVLRLASGEERALYFDITDFFGKQPERRGGFFAGIFGGLLKKGEL